MNFSATFVDKSIIFSVEFKSIQINCTMNIVINARLRRRHWYLIKGYRSSGGRINERCWFECLVERSFGSKRLLVLYHQWHGFYLIIVISFFKARSESRFALRDVILLLLLQLVVVVVLWDWWFLVLRLQRAIRRWLRKISWKRKQTLHNGRPLLIILMSWVICWIYRIKSVIFPSRSSISWSCPILGNEICILRCITTKGHKFLGRSTTVMDAWWRGWRFSVNTSVCWNWTGVSFAVWRGGGIILEYNERHYNISKLFICLLAWMLKYSLKKSNKCILSKI